MELGMKKTGALRTLIALVACLVVLLLGSVRAHAADNGYYYPGYDAAANGCVDLMNYMQRITVTVNGVDYTQDQLQALKDAGTPLTQKVGDKVSFNFLFALQGRAYASDDATRLDADASTHVVYTHGTTYLNGESVAAGQSGILDDSSLMADNTTAAGTYLRMDISWIYDICPGDYTISYTDGTVSFTQGTGDNSRYLYVYFPGGMGQDQYANPGYFTLNLTETKTFEKIHIPGTDGFYLPGNGGWDFYVAVTDQAIENTGDITTYGDILVKKVWVTDEANPTARIVLSYEENGAAKTAVRTITGNGSATFTIRSGMTNCKLTEDMTGLDGYTSSLSSSADGKTYTFTNAKGKVIQVSKKAAGAGEELPGAKMELYCTSSDGSESLVDKWTSGDTPHSVQLQPGNFRLHEDLSPKGYAVSTDIPFAVYEDYSVKLTGNAGELTDSTITVTDKPLLVKLAKTDPAGTSLAGAHLTLTDQTTGTLVDEWVSDGQLHTIQYASASGVVLVAGHTYVMTETAAPEGYALADSIQFVFNGDGTIPHCGYYTVIMQDAPLATPAPTPANPTANNPTPVPANQGGPSDPNAPVGLGVVNGTENTGDGGGGGAADNTGYSMVGVATGDSPLVWLWLVLGILCLLGAVVAGCLYYGSQPRRRGGQ